MRVKLILIFSLAFGSISHAQCIDSSLINPEMMCMTIYDPVCGCNGITYSNSCVAINYGGVTSFTTGECGNSNSCLNISQIDSTIFCPTVVEPVCGCDSVTYNNNCEAQYYAGVTSWTIGPCQNQVEYADSCADLSNIDFGSCSMILGYGLINGVCTTISGCGTLVNNIDYAPAILLTNEMCQNNCAELEQAPSCSDLSLIDFGVCQMPIGYGIVDNQCTAISGCSSISGNVDYINSLYASADSCQLCLSSQLNTGQPKSIQLFPNPVNSVLHIISTDNLLYSIYIADNQGLKIIKNDFFTSKITLNTEGLNAGIYHVFIGDENNNIRVFRFVKL